MRLGNCALFFLLIVTYKSYAQEIITDIEREGFRSVILDYLDVRNQEIVEELDSIKQSSNSYLPVTSEDIVLYRRSKALTKDIPLEYNDLVRSYIDRYTSSNYRPYMNRLLGLSKHYFPIYESILNEAGLPEEIKYLSLVESSLNPHLVSTSGAVGPWQFMYATAKMYNLEMNSQIDERKDAYSSSYAVTQYLNEAYQQFGDWLVALASYNCGRGCVQRAIKRSGIEKPTFWQLSPYLPKETRNYIPKYIAMTYVLSDADYFGIQEVSTELDFEHQVLLIDRAVHLGNVAKAIGLTTDELKKYNPAYKQNIVNGSIEKPKRLLLPITLNTNDSLLYLALHDSKILPQKEVVNDRILAGIKRYKVRRGETLSGISKKLGVSVQNLRAWNGLNSRGTVIAGRELIVEKPVDSNLAGNVKNVIASKRKENALIYTVKSGDSLDSIARRYRSRGASIARLKADNSLKSDLIRPGMKLKIN